MEDFALSRAGKTIEILNVDFLPVMPEAICVILVAQFSECVFPGFSHLESPEAPWLTDKLPHLIFCWVLAFRVKVKDDLPNFIANILFFF